MSPKDEADWRTGDGDCVKRECVWEIRGEPVAVVGWVCIAAARVVLSHDDECVSLCVWVLCFRGASRRGEARRAGLLLLLLAVVVLLVVVWWEVATSAETAAPAPALAPVSAPALAPAPSTLVVDDKSFRETARRMTRLAWGASGNHPSTPNSSTVRDAPACSSSLDRSDPPVVFV